MHIIEGVAVDGKETQVTYLQTWLRDEHMGIMTDKLNSHSDEMTELRSELSSVKNELAERKLNQAQGGRIQDILIIIDGVLEVEKSEKLVWYGMETLFQD